MKPTTVQQRMDLLTEINDVIRDTANTWCRRWNAGEHQDEYEINLRWQEDGTAVVEVDTDEVMRVQVEITVSALDYVDATNKATGFVITRTWATVPAGWFVQSPKGWFEVIASRRDGDRQMVTLAAGGQQGTFPRDPDAEVKVRRGTLADVDLDTAMAVLGEGAVIIDSTPPFDPPHVRT